MGMVTTPFFFFVLLLASGSNVALSQEADCNYYQIGQVKYPTDYCMDVELPDNSYSYMFVCNSVDDASIHLWDGPECLGNSTLVNSTEIMSPLADIQGLGSGDSDETEQFYCNGTSGGEECAVGWRLFLDPVSGVNPMQMGQCQETQYWIDSAAVYEGCNDESADYRSRQFVTCTQEGHHDPKIAYYENTDQSNCPVEEQDPYQTVESGCEVLDVVGFTNSGIYKQVRACPNATRQHHQEHGHHKPSDCNYYTMGAVRAPVGWCTSSNLPEQDPRSQMFVCTPDYHIELHQFEGLNCHLNDLVSVSNVTRGNPIEVPYNCHGSLPASECVISWRTYGVEQKGVFSPVQFDSCGPTQYYQEAAMVPSKCNDTMEGEDVSFVECTADGTVLYYADQCPEETEAEPIREIETGCQSIDVTEMMDRLEQALEVEVGTPSIYTEVRQCPGVRLTTSPPVIIDTTTTTEIVTTEKETTKEEDIDIFLPVTSEEATTTTAGVSRIAHPAAFIAVASFAILLIV